jgi:hypothetical protein
MPRMVEHRYPFAALAEAMGLSDAAAARALGLSGSTAKEYRSLGVSDVVADRLAVRAGMHPGYVWSDFFAHARQHGRCCAECGESFEPYRPHARYCCTACGRRANDRNYKRRRYARDAAWAAQERERAKDYYEACGDYLRAAQRRRYHAEGTGSMVESRTA